MTGSLGGLSSSAVRRLLRPSAIAALVLSIGLMGCEREECPSVVSAVNLSPQAFDWDDELQLGVFRPNGQKVIVSKRGDIPANAYHAVRVNLPDKQDVTPVPPTGLTWRVESALVDEPKAVLETELQLRNDAYVVHVGTWAADIVKVQSHVMAEQAESSEVADGLEKRAEALKNTLNAVSPSTGEEFEIPDMEMNRKLRFVRAQRPTLADFALDSERALDRAIVLISDCDACPKARTWADERGVRVLGPDDPESAAARGFFSTLAGGPMKFPMMWTNGELLFGFDSERWEASFRRTSAGDKDG